MSAIAFNDDQQLAFTQGLRRKLVEQFMATGSWPVDTKQQNILLSALKDYDKVTLTLKRLDSENANADADRQALAHFHRISQMMGTKDLHRVEEPERGTPTEGPATPFDPNDIPPVNLVEGELATGMDPVNYDDFMAEQTELHKERQGGRKG